jgi:RNA polymerase sigma-70 factor (ECF subfamily)
MAQMGMDEPGLVASLKQREPAGIEIMVKAHGERLLRSATLLCGDPTHAQDLVQDTFVEALRSIHRFRGHSSLYTWLHSILLNITRHHWRASQRLVYDNDLAAQENAVSEDSPNASDFESAGKELTRALRQLSETHREILVLRFYEQMKIHEIAAHLGISKGTVKSRLHYAIREMQKFLPAEMNLFGAGGTKEREYEL